MPLEHIWFLGGWEAEEEPQITVMICTRLFFFFTTGSPCSVRHLPNYKKSWGDTCPAPYGHKVQKPYIFQFTSSWPCIQLQFPLFSLLHNCTHHDWLNVSRWDRKNSISSLFMDFPSGISSAELHLSNGGTLTAVSTSLMRKLYLTCLVERWQDTSLCLCSWEMEPSDTNAISLEGFT